MKKLLLLACVAFTAMSVNAQVTAGKSSFTKEQLKQKTVGRYDIKLSDNTAANMITGNMKNVMAAPELGKLGGVYIEDSYDEIHESSTAEITIEGNQTKFSMASGSVTVSGTYDANTGIINVGHQNGGTYTDSRGTFTFEVGGIVKIDEEYDFSDKLDFTVSDNGVISCNQVGYYVGITGFVPATGSQYTESDMVGKLWTTSWETQFYPANAVQAGYTSGRSTGNKWVEYSQPVGVEDYEFSVNVYGFCGYGCLSIDINDDGTVSVLTGQPLYVMNLSDEDAAVYGKYFNFTGVRIEGSSIYTDYEKQAVTGTIKGNVITFDEYFRLCSLMDADQALYAENWYANGTTITLNEGNYLATSGIEEIGMTREDRIKNTKTYNIMGQQVDRSTAKGLLIRDGKKYIKK